MNDFLGGRVVEVMLVSADIAATFNALINRGVSVYRAEFLDPMTVNVSVSMEDYSIVEEVSREAGCEVTIRENKGIYWRLEKLLRRPILMISAVLLLLMTVFLPTRVLFFTVEGNRTVSDQEILEAAAVSGIKFGAERRAIRSEQAKNEIIALIPALRWVGINTYGCTAVITVSERQPDDFESSADVANIVALRDGLILSATVTRGTAQCAPGDTVVSGQILVSAYTDCGISLLASRADGEIYAQTERKLETVLPVKGMRKGTIQNSERRYSLIIGKKRINLWKGSGIWEPTCDRMYKEYRLKLPGGFFLPVAFVKEELQFSGYSESEQNIGPSVLSIFSERYLQKQMIAGKIVDKNILFSRESDIWLLEGEYICNEMIGRIQPERNGAFHGKSD